MDNPLLPFDATFNSFAEKLGFYDCKVYLRDNDYFAPLVYAYWREAPVALSMRSGRVSMAFFRGSDPSSYGLANSLLDQVYPAVRVVSENAETSYVPINDSNDTYGSSFDLDEQIPDSVFKLDALNEFIKPFKSDLAVDFSDALSSTDSKSYNTIDLIDTWDEVIDTNFAEVEALLIISKALLESYSNSREVIYQNIKHENCL